MNENTALAIINVSLIALIGLAIYVSSSLWPLFALFFLMYTKKNGSEEKEEAK